jgi:hypothetical protein
MGRQIHFHMLPEDRNAFLNYVQVQGNIPVALRDADTARIEHITRFDGSEDKILCLWNSGLLPTLERKWIPDPGYYRVDVLKQPVLEFRSSLLTAWEGKPALVQGRLYGIFDPYLKKPLEFEQWFDTLVRWIRKKFHKNPTDMGGYVGSSAYEFYEKGGYLLPQFLPPRTDVWLAEIAKQHQPANQATVKSSRRAKRP